VAVKIFSCGCSEAFFNFLYDLLKVVHGSEVASLPCVEMCPVDDGLCLFHVFAYC